MTAPRPFTPTREDPGALDARTVGADAQLVLERIVDRITAASSGNLAHTLVVGPRGAGKTHMLAVARHRATTLRSGSGAEVATVVVPEDGHGFVTYTELLRFIAGALGVDVPEMGVGGRDVGRLESRIVGQLGDAVLVLMVENLDRLFSKLGEAGQHDLRAWVETSRRVLLVASTPLLFDGVQIRDKPWFGSFMVEPLAELSAEEGARLLTNLRAEADPDLVAFLASESGQARVRALHQLTGGSPRLWTIFADVVTVDLLDELVPAVERLLEELVTYYQQRLWELGPNEERVVTALATGPVSQTATQLAEALGLDQRTMGSTVGRLADARWIRGRKVPGTDQRTTWYELREPMLRHYMQYRTDGHRELTLIVEMLRHWFDPTARERQLLRVVPGTEAERYLGAALNLDRPAGYDDGYESHSEEALLLQARRWINDPDAAPGFADAGVVLDLLLARRGYGTGERPCPPALQAIVEDPEVTSAEGTEAALDRAADAASGRLAHVLRWVAASWRIPTAKDEAERLLDALSVELVEHEDLLALHVAHDLAYLHALRDRDLGVAELTDIIAWRERIQGASHPDTLIARTNLADCVRHSGDLRGSLDLHRALLADRIAALGATHLDSLDARLKVATLTADVEGAWGAASTRTTFEQLLADELGVLGPDHEMTFNTRANLARIVGEIDGPEAGRDSYEALLADLVPALGPDHQETLVTRSQIAHLTGAAGDSAKALSLHEALLADRRALLGGAHPDTVRTACNVAYLREVLGDPVGALVEGMQAARHVRGVTLWEGAEDWLAQLLGTSMIRILKGGLTGAVPSELRTGGIGMVFDAAEGSPEALAQLPSELREIVEDVLAGRDPLVPGPGDPD